MVVMMDMEISCKGHCEKLSHFLDHVSHTEREDFSLRELTVSCYAALSVERIHISGQQILF